LTAKWRPPKDTRPSFEGQTVIVTGANIGLGFEAALKFVQLGAAKVVLAVRTLRKGEEAKHRIDESTGRKDVTQVWHLDMMDYESIKAFAKKVDTELDRLDAACLNAGLLAMPRQESQYGYETTLQVNDLSTALLSLLLLPKLRSSKTKSHTPVLEIVGSGNANLVTSFPDDKAPFAAFNKPENYSPPSQYNVSKQFVQYMQDGLVELVQNKKTGKPDVHVVVVCPGPCQSELARDAKKFWYFRWFMVIFAALQRTSEEGARTYMSGIAEGEKAHGKVWKDDEVKP
jgi:NAD(P)-dependent dehydrogenase (short-subunit alcohol dehydrogenase family)